MPFLCWMEYHNVMLRNVRWVVVLLFKSHMKKSQLLFLNAFSIKDAFSINGVFFLWIRATWMWALWGVRVSLSLEFLVVSCCSADPWTRGLWWPHVWLRKSSHSQVVLTSASTVHQFWWGLTPLCSFPAPFLRVVGHPAVPVSSCAFLPYPCLPVPLPPPTILTLDSLLHHRYS